MTEDRNRDARQQARQELEKRTVFTEIFNLFSLVGFLYGTLDEDLPFREAVRKQFEKPVCFYRTKLESNLLACLGCHGEDYKGVLGSWQEDVKAALDETKPVVEKARGLLRSEHASRKENRKAVSRARDAEYNYLFILYGKGIHNVEYATEVLRQARADAQAALASFSERNAPDPDSGRTAEDGGTEVGRKQ